MQPTGTGAHAVAFSRPRDLVILVIAVGAVLRILLTACYGLTYNETYVVVMSRHLALSYVDHPPLMMWLIAGMRWLTGSEADVVMRLPSIILCAGTTWLIYDIGRILFSARAGAYAAVAFSLSPLFSLNMGSLVITDAPMLFFVVLTARLLAQLLQNPPPAKAWACWLGAGLATGAGMLSKYNVAFVPAGVLLFMLTQPDYRRWFLRPAPYFAALLAALVFLPVVIWNAQHDWISLTFQGARALPEGGVKPVRLLAYLAITAIYIMPWIWLGLIAVFFKAIAAGPRAVPHWFLACLAVPPILFFTLVRLFANREDKGYHWAAPGYVMLFPLLGAAIESWMASHSARIRQWLLTSVAVMATVVVILVTHTFTGWIRVLHPEFAKRDPLITDQLDWTDLRSALRSRGLLTPRTFVAGPRWQDCVKADYALQGGVPVVCLTVEPLQLPFFQDQAAVRSWDAVIVTPNWGLDETRARLGPYFDAIEQLDPVMLGQFGIPTLRLNLFIGRNFRASYPWPYGPQARAHQ